MLTYQLIQLFLPVIQQGLVDRGYAGVIVKQAYQPTQQGAELGPTVYFAKLGDDERFGFVRRKSDADVHTEEQQYKTTFQFNAWVRLNPVTPDTYSASDLLNSVAQILESDEAIETFAAQDVGVLPVLDIRNPIFVDDQDQFENSPSFDIVFTHKQIRVTTDNPIVEDFKGSITVI